MNLHGIVRGAINTVNLDRFAKYLASTGSVSNPNYSQTPSYAPAVFVKIQIQPLGKEELRHVEKLNLTGVFRTIYMYGDTQGIVRVQAKGGDLLQFRTFQGEGVQNWKIVYVEGPWNVEYNGWTKLIAVLQTDTPTEILFTGTGSQMLGVVTIASTISGSIAFGNVLSGAGVVPGSIITSLGTYTAIAGVGTVNVDTSGTVLLGAINVTIVGPIPGTGP